MEENTERFEMPLRAIASSAQARRVPAWLFILQFK